MQKMWVTHLPHFLDEAGNLIEDLPAPARRLAMALCKFITYATNFDGEDDELPQCFIVTKRKQCQGMVMPLISLEDDNIVWHCPMCNCHGFISGWQGTLWDLSEMRELH